MLTVKSSIYFYKSLDRESVLYRSLAKIIAGEPTGFRIGGDMGFGADRLPWQEAATLTARFAVTVLKTDSASVFREMRLMLQEDQEDYQF